MNHIEERCAVDDVDYHAAVGDALMVLIGGLTPFVERVLSASAPTGRCVDRTAPQEGRREWSSRRYVPKW